MVVFTGSTVEEAIQKGLNELISKSFLVRKKGFLAYLVKNQPKWISMLLVKRQL